MRTVYLVLAIIGTVVPLVFFGQFFFTAEPGTAISGFVPALFVNGATAGFTADLLISSFVFWLYMWDRRSSGPRMSTFVVLNLFVGLSCALPAYLYVAASKANVSS